jgi:hypothetical protein
MQENTMETMALLLLLLLFLSNDINININMVTICHMVNMCVLEGDPGWTAEEKPHRETRDNNRNWPS